MNRAYNAWNRVVVCVERSSITILGQSDEGGKSLSLNRVKGLSSLEESTSCPESYKSVVKGAALIGFLELRGGTYLGVITRTHEEGRIGIDHRVFSIQDVEWIPISFGVNTVLKNDARHIQLVSNLLRGGDFYFSDSLDLDGGTSRFVWNHQHLEPFKSRNVSPEWMVNIIHGGFRSLNFTSVNRPFQFFIIARRSRYFAGTRYRKRGLNWDGDCANEVETEQTFIQFGPPDYVCTYKQVRGSVPLHWSQDFHNILGKPEIIVQNFDLELKSTRLHFDNLLRRYGRPIVPVSLLLTREGTSEANLGAEYSEAVNQFTIPGVDSVINFDLKLSASATTASSELSPQDTSAMFNDAIPLVSKVADKTSFTVQKNNEILQEQKGVLRSNCVDCLDRTSIFQYMVGLEILNRQLIFLGLLGSACRMRPSWACGSSVHVSSLLREIESMFDSISDQLALQYAGTAAHKKYSSGSSRQSSFDGGLINSGRELLISISRHYSSTFTDNDKQSAMNLLLGVYREVWQNVPIDEDICSVDGIDKYVHAVGSRHEDNDRSADKDQRLNIKSKKSHKEGFEIIRGFGDSKSLTFNPSQEPSGSPSVRTQERNFIF